MFISSKKKFINKNNLDKLLNEDISFIYALWHDQLLLSPLTWQSKKRIDILISKHRDGDMIADLIKFHGFNSIRGSTNNPNKEKEKNTLTSVRKILKSLKNNISIGITPDGPRGPRHKVGEGTINISRISNKKILPMSLACKKKWVLNTWDKFIVPKPFNEICIVWGEPLDPQFDKIDISSQQHNLEKSLISITELASNHIGS
ncbi:lysophospholipid acyltransferase family protein [Pelagibacteraceae bacterium]|nr:lysophospholipid acyltransferase family protein [Pelagibacteraceae bacterium]